MAQPFRPAPNSTGGTTRGLRLTVNNNDGTAATAGVSLYPKNKSFGGAYRLKFDLWINYPGGSGGSGSTGSTEHFTCGLNHEGSRVNWDSATANPSDGLWFAMDGEGGTTTDYRAYVGNASSSPSLLTFSTSGFSASGASGAGNSDSAWLNIFPSPTYESPGAPGKRWVEVELSQDTNNVITWRMNGQLIAQRVNVSPFTNGNVMIGYMDLFTSIASPAADAFVLFDNVRVEILATPTVPAITVPPQPVAVYPEEDATFSVAATGTAPLAYQWQFNGANIAGATNNSYTRQHVQAEDAGNYSVIVSNAAGTATSASASLTLLDSPYVSSVQSTPGSHSALIAWRSVIPGDSQVQFSINSGGSQNLAVAAAQSSFGSSSYLDPELTTNHVILLTGLTPGTSYSYQTLSRADTNTYLSGVYQFTTAGSLIMDNPAASYTGDWTVASSSSDKYSTDYHYATTVSGSATATATWRPNITTSGKYDVSIWYPQGANRANNAPLQISFNGGTTNIAVNQQSSGGAWRLIASGLEFAKGTNGFVRLANNANASVVLADAVKFDYVEAQDFPTNNTVPTWWRDFFFGGPVDPIADPDNDGYNTAREYMLGTNPTNALSRLKFSVTASNSTAQISFWPRHGDRSYQLLTRPDVGAFELDR
ncbi:MAG: immunoglobulin domain-containing protein [Verrucomicrobiota bacterium]